MLNYVILHTSRLSVFSLNHLHVTLLFCKLINSNNSKLCCTATRLLAFWYSHQQVFDCWQNTCSQFFNLARGVRQGGILSPYSLKLYVRDLLKVVVKSCIGCNIAGWFINILAYADDMVLLAPSWKGLQCLLDIIDKAAVDIDMSFNIKKTVCMIFNPLVKY